MKIIVTGGAGFIGSHIVDELLKKNHDVCIIDNLSTGKKQFINKKAKFYYQDILENISFIFEKEKPEIIIHAAAQTMLRESLKNPIFDAKTNILGTINVLEACRNACVKKIIYTSTGGARVGEPEYLPVDETHKINPESPYGISKHTAEHYIYIYNRLYNIDYLIFCFGNVYGPRDYPKNKRVVPLFMEKILNNEAPEIFGDGNQTRDFIYVKDLAEFLVESINKTPRHKLFHLANGVQISVNEIFNMLKKLSDFQKEPNYTESIKGEVKDIVLNISLAKEEFGWNPKTSIKEGLKETLLWFKNHYEAQQSL